MLKANAIITNGADVNADSKKPRYRIEGDRVTPLHEAMGIRSAEVAMAMTKLLISHGADVNAATGDFKYSPLHLAVFAENTQVADLLIASGAQIEATDKWGRTPLHCTATHQRLQTAELLLSKGAQVNLKDEKGRTPLACARKYKNNKVMELLWQHGAKE